MHQQNSPGEVRASAEWESFSGTVVRALDLRQKRSLVRLPAVLLSGNNLGQVVHTHVPLSPSSIIWYGSKGGDALWLGGNRRSGVALAVRHRLQWFIHLRADGPSKGHEHPAYTPHGLWHIYFLYNDYLLYLNPVAGFFL